MDSNTRAKLALEWLCQNDENQTLPFRAAVLVAHPDDEVIGLGSCLKRLRKAHFVHVTDGAPRNMLDARSSGFTKREDYARARRRELEAALTFAGVPLSHAHQLGFADQEISQQQRSLIKAIFGFLVETVPDIIFTHPFEGGHPDHDSTAFAVHTAHQLLVCEGFFPPSIIEFTSYHMRNGQIATGQFLSKPECHEVILGLSEEERRFKQKLLACFVSQQNTLQYFATGVERFRPAPVYDFLSRPHPGRLFYEHFEWGMNWEQWQMLTRETLEHFGLLHDQPIIS